MSLEQSFERIAAALEKIADAMQLQRIPGPINGVTASNAPAVTSPTAAAEEKPAPKAEKPAKAAKESPVVKEAEKIAKSADEDRNAIKAELDAMKIPYNNKASTDTLAKLLENAKLSSAEQKPAVAPSAAKAPASPTPAAEVAVAAPTTELTVDVMREHVKKYAAIQGSAKAIALLAKYKANNVSGVNSKDYAKLLEDINKELKG